MRMTTTENYLAEPIFMPGGLFNAQTFTLDKTLKPETMEIAK